MYVDATIIDLYLYLRKQLYVEYALTKNRVDPSIDRHYQAVDTNGVIDMSYYDLLVLRARYSHSISRLLPSAKTNDDSAGSANSPEPKHSQVRPTQVTEDQTKAHQRFDDFNRLFADFVRRVDPAAVLPKTRVASGKRRSDDNAGASDDEINEDNALRSPLESPIMLTEFRTRAKMLEQLYSTNHLTLIICYYDFVIKNGLIEETGLAEYGGSDLAADVISFLNIFTTDAILHAGGRPWGHTKEELDSHSTRTMLAGDHEQNDSHSRNSVGRVGRVYTRSKSTVQNEVELAKVTRNGRRFLLNSNKLLGNNLRQFLTDRQVDWLSLDDVLDVLQQEIEVQAKHLQRAISKDPVLQNTVFTRPAKPGEDELAPWVASGRSLSSGGAKMVAVSNPIWALDAVDEDEEEEVDED